jgi:dihydrofolate synthase/folylpolyglutamate synthase
LDFDSAIAWLDDHLNLEQSPAVAGSIEGLSLEPMQRVVHVLGDPQDSYPVIHLTGTNGKGSTARMTAALLVAHGLSVGTYTSPHLEEVTERISWNLLPIERDELARVVTELADLEPLMAEELQGTATQRPSYFELLTAAAYSYFSDVAVDAAVVEVGMLGTWDATNVADARVAVITNIGRDHTDGEGDWRRRIAEEKAGIIDPGSTVILGETDEELRPIFEARPCEQLWLRDRDFGWVDGTLAIGGRRATFWTPHGECPEVFVPLHGAHQLDNAAAAFAAVVSILGRVPEPEVIESAFAGFELPGRFEVLHRGPLLVLDGAHNPDGAQVLAETLADEFAITGKRVWVLGTLAGRDIDLVLDGLGLTAGTSDADHVITCTPGPTRGVPADELATHLTKRGITTEVVPDVGDALLQAWQAAVMGPRDDDASDAVIVTGSLRTVGQARPACRKLGLFEP